MGGYFVYFANALPCPGTGDGAEPRPALGSIRGGGLAKRGSRLERDGVLSVGGAPTRDRGLKEIPGGTRTPR